MITEVTKYFTPLEAKKTLPLVKKIIKDILDTSKEIKFLADDLDGKIEDNPRAKKMIENINGFIGELEEIGCFYKDYGFTLGLVDFPALINGREVLLCWRSDEEEIKFYHGVDAGYTGRKLIPEEYF
ncbi:MAG: DUF2203 family protein [Ignavibacteriaceae bacterium]